MKVEKIELYKVKDFDCLYLDKDGTPYIVKPKAVRYSGAKTKEITINVCKSGWQSRGTTVFLKYLIARTLLGATNEYVWYKDDNPMNCTTDNLVLLDKPNFKKEYTEENSFVCKECGNRFFRKGENMQTKICSSCKRHLEQLEKIKIKENEFISLYEYLVEHKGMYRQTDLRDKIFERLKDGKNYSQIAREIGVSRQCVHDSVQTALEMIERKEKAKGKNND